MLSKARLAFYIFLLFILGCLTYVLIMLLNYENGSAPCPHSEAKILELKQNMTEPIDIVYTWVDGEDDVRNALRQKIKDELDGVEQSTEHNSTTPNRFLNFNEIEYSVRSVKLYAPWIRNIFIVCSGGQIPKSVVNIEGVKIIYEEDLVEDHSVRPTFNSHAIECCIHRIPGLAERFIYSCDDMFICQPIEPSFFFTDDNIMRLRQHSSKKTSRCDIESNSIPHSKAWSNNNTNLDKVCGYEIRAYPSHQMTAMTISAMKDAEETFQDVWFETEKHQFRHKTDIHPFGLAQYLASYRKTAKWEHYSNNYNFIMAKDNTMVNYIKFIYFIHNKSSLKCMNDNTSHTKERVDKQVKKLLQRLVQI